MSKTELYLSGIVKYGLYAILLTPLAFWPKALFPFLTPKFILFQILVEIVFGAWIATQLLNNANITNKYANDANSESQKNKLAISGISKNYILLALLCFTAISFVSAIFGIDFQRSFWGIGARMTGLFAELHFIAWFLVLASSLNNANNINKYANDANRESQKNKLAISGIGNKFLDWHYYLNFSFAICVIVALSAFYQNPKWVLAVGSTIFNNPTFAAPYFIFHFFWGVHQSISQSKKRWFWILASVFLFIAIILTQIRGAIIGLLVGIFAFGIAAVFTGVLSRRSKTAVIISYLILIAGVIVFWNIRGLPAVKNIPFLKKINQTSLTETTVQTRLLDWQEAVAGFKDRPLLGAGPENYNFVFNAHYNPEFARFADDFAETWSDKPHNAFLEILAETGIVGSLSYALLWLAVVLALLKLFKSEKKLLSLTLLSAFIAYFGAVFFSFDSFGSWFGLFLFLAFLASHNNANAEENMRMPRITNTIHSRLTLFAIILAVFALLYVNCSIWRANLADADALRTFPKDPEQGIGLFKKSLNYFTPYKAEYRFDFAGSVMTAVQRSASIPDLENILNLALEEIDQAIAAHPKNAAYYSDAAKLYNILGGKGADPAVLNQAELFAKKSLELSPNRQEALFYLAQTALVRQDIESAIKWTRQAIDVYPEWRNGHWYLGRIYFVSGRYKESAVEIKKALELGYQPQNQTEKNFIKNLGL